MSMLVTGHVRDDAFHVSNGLWILLWQYCREILPEVAQKVVHYATNDGDGLDDQDARALAQAIRDKIASGDAQRYAAIVPSEKFFLQHLERFADFLESCGGFSLD